MEERERIFLIIFLGGILMIGFEVSRYLEFPSFSGTMFCCGIGLLNQSNRSAKLGGGFNRTKLLMLEILMLFL